MIIEFGQPRSLACPHSSGPFIVHSEQTGEWKIDLAPGSQEQCVQVCRVHSTVYPFLFWSSSRRVKVRWAESTHCSYSLLAGWARLQFKTALHELILVHIHLDHATRMNHMVYGITWTDRFERTSYPSSTRAGISTIMSPSQKILCPEHHFRIARPNLKNEGSLYAIRFFLP